jgi:putative ATP-dependent endonuclease of the OLD family
LFIAVEGPNDIVFLQTISGILSREDDEIPDLTKLELNGEIIFVPLGGSALAIWASWLSNLNRSEFHLCHSDTTRPL